MWNKNIATNLGFLSNGYYSGSICGESFGCNSNLGMSSIYNNLINASLTGDNPMYRCSNLGYAFGSGNTDGILGYFVGKLPGMVMQVVSNVMAQKQAAKTDNSLETQLNEIHNKISEQENTVGTKNDAATRAQNEFKANEEKILQPCAYHANEVIIENYKNKDEENKPTDDEYNKAVAANKASDAAENAKADLKKKLDTAKDELGEEQEKLKKLQAEHDKITKAIEQQEFAATLDKADGSKRQQTKGDDVKALFNEKGDVKPHIVATQKDIRGAIAQYKKATDENEKEDWAKKIFKLWDTLSLNERDDSLVDGIKAMKKNYPDLV